MQYARDISASRIDIHRIILTLNALSVPLTDVRVLADDWLKSYFRCESLDVFLAQPEEFKACTLLLCVDQDDHLYEVIDACIAHNISYYPVRHADRLARYWHFNHTARQSLQEEKDNQAKLGFSHWDSGDFANIIQAIDITRNKPGTYVEIGTFNGASGSIALNHMRRIGIRRDAFFFDVFSGFTYETALSSADAMWAGTHQTKGYDTVSRRLKSYETDNLSVTVKHMDATQDPLPDAASPIAVANIDVDLYEAVLGALERIAPHVVPGGIMIVEDAGHTPMLIGARRALERFCASPAGQEFLPVYLESGQTYLICMRPGSGF